MQIQPFGMIYEVCRLRLIFSSLTSNLARSFLVFFCFIPSLTLAEAELTDTQIANTSFSEALRIYSETSNLKLYDRLDGAQEVLRIFELITVASPETIPGKRISSGEKIGPIDRRALLEFVSKNSNEVAFLFSMPNSTAKGYSLGFLEPISFSTESESSLLLGIADELLGAAAGKPRKSTVSDPGLWYQSVVEAKNIELGFSHGQFPSFGPRTHPGIDVLAPCGSDVKTLAAGEVLKVVAAGSPDFWSVGNAVFIRHEDDRNNDAQPTVAVYLNLGGSPSARLGEIDVGQKIGVAGIIDHIEECGVHVELRHFKSETNVFHPLWHGILAVGDWSEDDAFIDSWSDPEAWLRGLVTLNALANNEYHILLRPLATLGQYTLMPRTLLTDQFDDTYRYLQTQKDQPLNAEMAVRAKRTSGGLEVKIERLKITRDLVKIFPTVNYESPTLLIEASILCDQCAPVYELSKVVDVQFQGRIGQGDLNGLRFLVPENVASISEKIEFHLEFNGGKKVSFERPLELGSLKEILEAPRLSEQEAKSFLRRVQQCNNLKLARSQSLTISVRFSPEAKLSEDSIVLRSYENSSGALAEARFQNIRKSLAKCGALGFELPSEKYSSWETLDIRLGETE